MVWDPIDVSHEVEVLDEDKPGAGGDSAADEAPGAVFPKYLFRSSCV